MRKHSDAVASKAVRAVPKPYVGYLQVENSDWNSWKKCEADDNNPLGGSQNKLAKSTFDADR